MTALLSHTKYKQTVVYATAPVGREQCDQLSPSTCTRLQVEHLGAKLWLAPFFAEPSRQTPHFFTPLSASPFTISHWAGPYEYYL